MPMPINGNYKTEKKATKENITLQTMISRLIGGDSHNTVLDRISYVTVVLNTKQENIT